MISLGDVCQIVLAVAVLIYTVIVDRNAKRKEENDDHREKVTRTIEAYAELSREVLARFELAGTEKEIERTLRASMSKSVEQNKNGFSSETYKKLKQDMNQIELFAKALYEDIYDRETFIAMANPDFGSNIAPRMRGYFNGSKLSRNSFPYSRRLQEDTMSAKKKQFEKNGA